MAKKAEAIASGLLTAAVITMAAIIAYRQFFPVTDSSGEEAPKPSFEKDWRSLKSVGTLIGSPEAKISIVEFGDLQCPACRGYQRVLKRTLEKYNGKVSITFIHFPLPYHKQAMPAARALECAGAQGQFEPFLNLLYQEQDSLGTKPWERFAGSAGVKDFHRFSACAADTTKVVRIESGLQAGERFKVEVIPTIIINGWRYTSPPSEHFLQKLIDDLLDTRSPASSENPSSVSRTPILPSQTTISGIPVLEHTDRALAEAPIIEMEAEALALAGGGQVPADFDLSHLGEVALLPDNRIMAALPRSGALLIFGQDGKPEKRWGRFGEGPGEFRRINGIAVLSDGMVVIPDAANSRLTKVSPDRGIISSARIFKMPTSFLRLVGILKNGDVLLYPPGMVLQGVRNRVVRPPAPILLLTGGDSVRTIVEIPDLETVMVETRFEGETAWEPTWVRFGNNAHAVLWDTVLVTGSGEAYRLDLRTPDGKISGAILVKTPRRALTKAMRDAHMAPQIVALEGGREAVRDPKEARRLIEEAPYADSLPPYGDFYVSPRKVLWIMDATAPTDTTWTATAFRRDGAILGRLTGSLKTKPAAFGDDRIVLRSEDAEGFVTLEVHRLRPSLSGLVTLLPFSPL